MTDDAAPEPLAVGPDTRIADLLDGHPEVAETLAVLVGGDCSTCVAAETETLADAARLHGLDTDALIGDVLRAVRRPGDPAASPPGPGTLPGAEASRPPAGEVPMEENIKKALEEIRPRLQDDGGDVEFVSVENGEVRVRLKGACGGCPMAAITLKRGIERILKERVPGVESVVAVE